MRHSFFGLGRFQADAASGARKRCDPMDAEFDGLLDDLIHAFASSDNLSEVDIQPALAFRIRERGDLYDGLTGTSICKPGLIFSAAAIE